MHAVGPSVLRHADCRVANAYLPSSGYAFDRVQRFGRELRRPFESTPAAPRGAPRLRPKRWKSQPDPAVHTDTLQLAGCTEPNQVPSYCVSISAVARVPGLEGYFAPLSLS